MREQVEWDYARARRRALVGRLAAWARRRCASLCAFDEARRERGAVKRRYLGRRTVEVDRVVGSVGRWRDFDGGWVDLALRTGRDLPPVVLYKLGDAYYVHDGNHRVSVARFEGVAMIEAEVTEFFSRRAGAVGVAG